MMDQTIWKLMGTCLVLLCCYSSKVQIETDLLGNWQIQGKEAFKIEISRNEEGSFNGKIREHLSRPELNGKTILKAFNWLAKDKQFKGTLIPPTAKMELKATIDFLSPEKLQLTARKSFLTRKMELIKLP